MGWSKGVTDGRMSGLMLARRAEGAVEEAVKHRNACGGGAIAATLAACEAYGAKRTHLLEHTTSAEVGRELSLAAPRDAVGYAGIVID